MRSDLFLSYLLFGITTLTCLLATAQLVAYLVLSRIHAPPRVRAGIRVAALTACLAGSLVILLSKLPSVVLDFSDSGGGATSVLTAPRPVSAGGLDKFEEIREPQGIYPPWTLFEKTTTETLSAVAAQSDLLRKSGSQLLSLVRQESAPECRAWISKASELGVGIREADLGIIPAGAAIALCLSDPYSTPEWEKLRSHVNKGGTLFVMGRSHLPGTETVLAMLGAKSWQPVPRGDRNGERGVVFGGQWLSYGGLTAGLRVDLGQEWFDQEDTTVAEASGQAVLVASGMMKTSSVPLTPLIITTHGKGRIVWTSLPASLYGRLNAIHGVWWRLLSLRLFSYLLRIPAIGLEPWPSGAEGAVVTVVNGDIENEIRSKLSEMLRQEKIKLTVLSHGAGDVSGRTAWSDAAYVFPRRRKVRHGMVSAVETFVQFKHGKKAGLVAFSPDPNLGAAAIAASMDYVLLVDSETPMLSPFIMEIGQTKKVRDAIMGAEQPGKNTTDLSTTERSIVIVPLIDRTEEKMTNEVAGEVLESYRKRSWLGGAYAFPFHSGMIDGLASMSVLQKLIHDLKKQGAIFTDASGVAGWIRARSSVRFVHEKNDANDIQLIIKNDGSTALENAVIRLTEADSWRVDGLVFRESVDPISGMKRALLNIPRIDSGKELRIRLIRFRRAN